MDVLYKLDAGGGIRVWAIDIIASESRLAIRHGVYHGAQQTKFVPVTTNFSGRSIEQQLQLEYESRVNKQKDLGYKTSIDEAKLGRTNALSLPKPMLAKPLKDCAKINISDAYVQPKLDGHRCLVTRQNGKIIAYSRQGKLLDSIGHILDGMDIPEGVFLDGELYCHGVPLQRITSYVKRYQSATKMLMYHIYDIIEDVEYSERMVTLNNLSNEGKFGQSACLVPTESMMEINNLDRHFNNAKGRGYEGLIIRPMGFGYQAGTRSKGLIKMKKFADQEFLIIDISVTADGWGVFTCKLPNGGTFAVTAPGSHEEKIHVANHPEQYINKKLKVQYANLTQDGVPFHPVALSYRETWD